MEPSRQLNKQRSRNSCVLYVSNLPHSIAPVHLEAAIQQHAHVEPVGVELLKKGTAGFQKTCGLAVVTLSDKEVLDEVLHKLDGKLVLGRPMIVRKDRFVEDDNAYETAPEHQHEAVHVPPAK